MHIESTHTQPLSVSISDGSRNEPPIEGKRDYIQVFVLLVIIIHRNNCMLFKNENLNFEKNITLQKDTF